MTTIGWIGTGVMGVSMAGHLQAAGHDLYVFNRTRAKAEPLISKGAHWCESAPEVAAYSEIIFTMVSLPADVTEVYLGERSILSVDGPCRIVVDMTTSRPTLAHVIAEKASKESIDSLDAPVSGGDIGARNATLAIMVGGDKTAFEIVLPLLRLMGQNISRIGGPGAGQHTKMCNQIVIAGTMIGVCESLIYAVKAGLEPARVLESITKGAAGCWSLDNLAPRMLGGDFAPGFMIDHFIKDMGIALEEARRMSLTLPGLALVESIYKNASALGHGRDGTQALYQALLRQDYK